METFAFDPAFVDATPLLLMLGHVPPHFWIYLGLAALARWAHGKMHFGYLLVALLALLDLAG